jgi:hypothetical protein
MTHDASGLAHVGIPSRHHVTRAPRTSASKPPTRSSRASPSRRDSRRDRQPPICRPSRAMGLWRSARTLNWVARCIVARQGPARAKRRSDRRAGLSCRLATGARPENDTITRDDRLSRPVHPLDWDGQTGRHRDARGSTDVVTPSRNPPIHRAFRRSRRGDSNPRPHHYERLARPSQPRRAGTCQASRRRETTPRA